MWNVADEEDTKLSNLSSKDKIAMLTTIQKFIEDAPVAEMVQSRYPKVWPLIVHSLDTATEELLGTNKTVEVSVDRLTAKVDALAASPLLNVLEAMIKKFEERTSRPAQTETARPSVPQPSPNAANVDELSPQEKAELINRRFSSRGQNMPVGGF
jgi:hypothetical protein